MRVAFPCLRSRFSWHSSVAFARNWYAFLSHWARGDRTLGPLRALSIRNWMAVASVFSPMNPPKASISRTICPLAWPPMAGLQDICPTESSPCVSAKVLQPSRAEARHASMPACPAPITITSYLVGYRNILFHVERSEANGEGDHSSRVANGRPSQFRALPCTYILRRRKCSLLLIKNAEEVARRTRCRYISLCSMPLPFSHLWVLL